MSRDVPKEVVTRLLRWRSHPWHMVEDGVVYTLDSVDLKNPIKKFPNKEYLKIITDIWLNADPPLVAIPKSRRVLMSWLVSYLHLHLAMFNEGARIYFQSEKEPKSAELLDRVEFIYDHIPQEMMPKWALPKIRRFKKPPKIEFVGLNTTIEGVPEGARQLAQFTATAVLMDEAAFWQMGKESFGALKPTTEGGGRVTVISSANKGWFYDLCYDKQQ